MPPMLVKQVRALPVIPGDSHPQITPKQITLTLAIRFDGHGYVLQVQELSGKLILCRWHPSLAKAEQSAQAKFGICQNDWEHALLP